MNHLQLVFQTFNFGKTSLKRIFPLVYNINPKRIRSVSRFTDLRNFAKLFETEIVKCFLLNDWGFILADNYLIAITCIYLIRADLPSHCYDARHFFSALYLAHEMEEDFELLRREITPWFPVTTHESNHSELLKLKNIIWKRMNYECFVTKDVCDQLMRETADWNVWKRIRNMEKYVRFVSKRRNEIPDTSDMELTTSDWECDPEFLYLKEDKEN